MTNVRLINCWWDDGGQWIVQRQNTRLIAYIHEELGKVRQLEPAADWHLETRGTIADWHRWEA